ncbi:MAG: matrixin family metalloprotease [Candidatus Nanoarchaeia archaeon]
MLKELFIIILLTILALLSYFIYLNLPGEPLPLKTTYQFNHPNVEKDLPAGPSQFEEGMRFNHNNLTYQFLTDCNQDKKTKMLEAFDIIEDRTNILTFKETTNDADIIVSCSKEMLQKQENQFIAGEGGPSKYLNLSIYPLILEGSIILYEELYNIDCNKPIIEIHELLHVFGFEHLNNSDYIMYPYFSCEQEIHPGHIQLLKEIYNKPAKAELYFKDIEAVKKGRYLDFEAIVENQGIITAKNIKLILIEQNKEVEEFEFDNIEPGAYQKLTTKNVRLDSRYTKEITFKITTITQEYQTSNNELIMEIEE